MSIAVIWLLSEEVLINNLLLIRLSKEGLKLDQLINF